MLIFLGGRGEDISIIHAYILRAIYIRTIGITLYCTGNKLLQFGLEENKYNNKSLNHASLNHAVHYAALQNTELTIYQETIQLAQIKIKFFQ